MDNSTRMCRTCQSVHELMDIFDTENVVLVFMIQQLAQIFIEEDDLLPKQICSSCANSLKMASEFVVQCQKTDKILRARFEKIILAEETPHTSTGSDLSVKIEPIEEMIIQPKSDLDSITVKEEYPEEVELVEKGVSGGKHNKFIDDEGIGFGENNIIEMDEDFVVETLDMALVNHTNEYSEEVVSDDAALELEPDIASSKSSKCVSSGSKVKVKKPGGIKEKKTYICSICSALFINSSEFKEHRRTHLPYTCVCKICGRQFVKGSGLKTHMEAHNGIKVECHLCGKKCSSINLPRHIRQTHHNIRPHSCEVCGAQFARKSELKIHAAGHTEERNFTCDTCGKNFKTSTALSIHKRRHRPDFKAYRHVKKYICEHCGKSSNVLANHIAHQKIHSDVKEFECKECHKEFHYKTSLDTHMRCHTGEKPHICDICGKGFRQTGHLTSHKRAIHYPETRVFACKLCKKSFATSSALKVHERNHTGDRPYKCDDCPSRFIDASGLKSHRRRVHDETLDSSNAVKTVVLNENNSIMNQDQKHMVDEDVVVD